MGMLNRALSAGFAEGADVLKKDYEREQDTSAKKDLMAYEGQIRQNLQDRMNEFTGQQNDLQRRSTEGIHAADRASREKTARDTNDLGYYQADINLGRNIADADHQKAMEKISAAGVANASAQLKLEQQKFDWTMKHSDLPESARTEVSTLQRQADEYFKAAKDQTLPPEERDRNFKLGNAAMQAARDRLAPFAPKTDKPEDPSSGGPDRRTYAEGDRSVTGQTYLKSSVVPSVAEPPSSAGQASVAPAKAAGGMLSSNYEPPADSPVGRARAKQAQAEQQRTASVEALSLLARDSVSSGDARAAVEIQQSPLFGYLPKELKTDIYRLVNR